MIMQIILYPGPMNRAKHYIVALQPTHAHSVKIRKEHKTLIKHQ